MLVGSPANSRNSRITKRAVVLVGFVFVFLLASVAIGLRTSNAALPYSRGCHGGGDGGDVTCTTTSSTVLTTSTVSTDQSTATSTVAQTTTTTSVPQVENSPIVPASPTVCTAITKLGYQILAPGTKLTIAFNGNGQMTFTVPSQSFTWNWYWVPAGGADPNTLEQQITSAMWADGHGQNLSFFVASLNGQTGLVLQTDYALAQACA